MLISFIITVRDEAPQVLAATLDGLRATASWLNTETVIVDDGSATPVRPPPDVRLIRNPLPAGVSASRRTGAATAGGQVLVWLDAHMSFGEGWLEQMLVQLTGEMLLCSEFYSYDLRERHCSGADFVWNATRNHFTQKYPGFGVRHRTDLSDRPLVDVPMVIGACYMMERGSYRQLGGFSPHFRVWGADEQDISARAWMAGFRVCCATYARVGHLSRAAFPYPVSFDHLEFNQAVMVRTLFEPATVRRFEACFEPLSDAVRAWLAETDLTSWRATVQGQRRLSDAEFFGKFVPELAHGR